MAPSSCKTPVEITSVKVYHPDSKLPAEPQPDYHQEDEEETIRATPEPMTVERPAYEQLASPSTPEQPADPGSVPSAATPIPKPPDIPAASISKEQKTPKIFKGLFQKIMDFHKLIMEFKFTTL